ncbi:hypothetical protein [Vibrio cyclitrophicus]|uniref:hypothetical protein n=1 Tax=Vibrio cyclitrophicus TaxID=47951 RepID=UPI000AB9B681|nr:hypothetical protein [Vibrio cyclitrophicus]
MSKYDLGKMMNDLDQTHDYLMPTPDPILSDRRTRAERREDFEKRLGTIDKDFISNLKETVIQSEINSNEYQNCKEDIEDTLIKFLRLYDEFKDLNSEESRKVALKEQELRVEAKHDWAEKFRLFFFRILASILFIISLFSIGYIEKEYDWATLPLSKYVSVAPTTPFK